MGDFARYVVEPGVHHFTRHPIDKPLPDKIPYPGPKFMKSRWKAFVRALAPEQRATLARFRELTDSRGSRTLDPAAAQPRAEFFASLSPELSEKFAAVWVHPKARRLSDDYPADRAGRWVFTRTLSLGWTPKLFGEQDRLVGHDGNRGEHKAERWGKKYQWMAYHELLARVADNFHPTNLYGNLGLYDGLHQITGDREIDPSLPPVPYDNLAQPSGKDCTWDSSPVVLVRWPPVPIAFASYVDADAFMADRTNEPTLDRMLFLADNSRSDWIMLDGYVAQRAQLEDDGWNGPRQTFLVNSWFAPAGEGPALQEHLAAARRDDRFGLIDTHGHTDCCYLGEIGWSPNVCDNAHPDFEEHEIAGRNWRLANTVEAYTWEGSLLDCSISDSVSCGSPSQFVHRRVALRLDRAGPSWSDGTEMVFTNIGRWHGFGNHAFLVRGSWLAKFLADHELVLATASWHERRAPRSSSAGRDDARMKAYYAAAWIGPDLVIRAAPLLPGLEYGAPNADP